MREKTKRRLFGLISAVIGIVLSVAAIEGLAILWLMAEDGRYTPSAELFERTQNTYVRDLTRGTNCRYGAPGDRPGARRSRACSPCRRISQARGSASSPSNSIS